MSHTFTGGFGPEEFITLPRMSWAKSQVNDGVGDIWIEFAGGDDEDEDFWAEFCDDHYQRLEITTTTGLRWTHYA